MASGGDARAAERWPQTVTPPPAQARLWRVPLAGVSVRSASLHVLGRLVSLNPAQLVPALRTTLKELLVEAEVAEQHAEEQRLTAQRAKAAESRRRDLQAAERNRLEAERLEAEQRERDERLA